MARQFMALARNALHQTLYLYLGGKAVARGLTAPKTYTFTAYPIPWGPLTADALPAVVVVPERTLIEPETGGQTHFLAEEHHLTVHVGWLIERPGSDNTPAQWAQATQGDAELWVQAVEEVLQEHRDLGLGAYQAFAFVVEHQYQVARLWQYALERSLLNSLAAVALRVQITLREAP